MKFRILGLFALTLAAVASTPHETNAETAKISDETAMQLIEKTFNSSQLMIPLCSISVIPSSNLAEGRLDLNDLRELKVWEKMGIIDNPNPGTVHYVATSLGEEVGKYISSDRGRCKKFLGISSGNFDVVEIVQSTKIENCNEDFYI